MERLWENGLPLWKVYGDPYRLPSHLLPGLVYIQAKKIPPTTIHAKNNNTKVFILFYFNILYPMKNNTSVANTPLITKFISVYSDPLKNRCQPSKRHSREYEFCQIEEETRKLFPHLEVTLDTFLLLVPCVIELAHCLQTRQPLLPLLGVCPSEERP